MSHGDYMAKVPEGFELVAHTDTVPDRCTSLTRSAASTAYSTIRR